MALLRSRPEAPLAAVAVFDRFALEAGQAPHTVQYLLAAPGGAMHGTGA
jgi:hypothetical protein